jgi:flagellar hook-associated protein 3 FlgL
MYNYKNALNRTYQQQQHLFEQADGSKIHRGSDNPVAYGNLMRYEFTQNENEQYQANVDSAVSWMKNSDNIISNMSDNIRTLSTKANQAANSYLSETDSKSIAREMSSIIEETISGCNYQLGDRFLFAGQKDSTQPFTISSDNVTRGLAKNLDAKQAEFFKGTRGNVNTELYQMLTLEDTKGNTYYLDNVTGYIYSKDFVDEGYKDLIANGYNYITDVDAAEYAAGNARMTEKNAVSTIEAADSDAISAVIKGESTDNDLKRAFRRIGESADSDTYISEIATALQDAGKKISEDDIKSAISQSADVPSVMVSEYFDNRGVINDKGEAGITVTLGEESTTLNFTTIQQRVVTYSGDNNHISMVKLNGATDTRSDIVNVTGQDLFGCDIFDDQFSGNEKSGTAMLNNIITVYNKTDACDVHWLSSDGITLADTAHATLIVAQTTLGARLQLYNNVDEMLDNQSVIITGDITELSGTDVAELATKLMELTNIYNLALSLGGRVLPQSLADYL